MVSRWRNIPHSSRNRDVITRHICKKLWCSVATNAMWFNPIKLLCMGLFETKVYVNNPAQSIDHLKDSACKVIGGYLAAILCQNVMKHLYEMYAVHNLIVGTFCTYNSSNRKQIKKYGICGRPMTTYAFLTAVREQIFLLVKMWMMFQNNQFPNLHSIILTRSNWLKNLRQQPYSASPLCINWIILTWAIRGFKMA